MRWNCWSVVMGGPMNIYEDIDYPWLADEKRFIERAITAGRACSAFASGRNSSPMCWGQGVCQRGQGKSAGFLSKKRSPRPNYSPAFPQRVEVFHWHGDTFDIPAGAVHMPRAVRVVRISPFRLLTAASSGCNSIWRRSRTRAPAHRSWRQRSRRRPLHQTPQAMLSDPGRFARVNRLMQGLLDRLVDENIPDQPGSTRGVGKA